MESAGSTRANRLSQTIESSGELIHQVMLLNSNLQQLHERLRHLDSSLQNLGRALTAPNTARGLTEEEIAGLEEVRGEGEDCVICLEPQWEASVVLQCHHRFHKKCIGNWVRITSKCPSCRGDISKS